MSVGKGWAEIRTVGDLIAALCQHDSESLILVDGYEQGFSLIGRIDVVEVRQIERGDRDWIGRCAATEDLESDGLPIGFGEPRLPAIGDPMHALILRREGSR